MNDYTTTDIYLAATLSALDYILLDITQEENKFIFHFEKESKSDPDANINADQYWTGNLLVDPKTLFSKFKEIKARMYDLRRSKNG
jgi:hypothetical protein